MIVKKVLSKVKPIWHYVLVTCLCTALLIVGFYQLEVLIILNYEVVHPLFKYFDHSFIWWFVRDVAYTYAVISYITSFTTSIFIRREQDLIVKTLLLIQGLAVSTIGLYMFNQLHIEIVKSCMVMIDKWFELPFGYPIPTNFAYKLFTWCIFTACHLQIWLFYIFSIARK